MDLNSIKEEIQQEKEKLSVYFDSKPGDNLQDLNNKKSEMLGKNSLLSRLFSQMKNIDDKLKKSVGAVITSYRDYLNKFFSEKEKEYFNLRIEKQILREKIDVTLPGNNYSNGANHPYYKVIDDISSFFISLGYNLASGPEVELEEYNFEKVNIPSNHPSRDMQDSFSISDKLVLRSHTSPVQARTMLEAKGKGPIKIICPGKVYRRDNDATHSHQFGQIEGLVVSKDITFSALLATLTDLLKYIFGKERKVRFKPSFFPFTEPSVEADVECFECHGKGCSLCKNTGFIEILGAGMVHPNVLRLHKFTDKEYKGFAFGLGVDRIAMLKYGIDDIKRFYVNDINFLKQFTKE